MLLYLQPQTPFQIGGEHVICHWVKSHKLLKETTKIEQLQLLIRSFTLKPYNVAATLCANQCQGNNFFCGLFHFQVRGHNKTLSDWSHRK